MTTLNLSLCYQDLGLTEPPFQLTPDTDFFFPGSHHVEALNHLRLSERIQRFGRAVSNGLVPLAKTSPIRP
jgi:hypothetical protein